VSNFLRLDRFTLSGDLSVTVLNGMGDITGFPLKQGTMVVLPASTIIEVVNSHQMVTFVVVQTQEPLHQGVHFDMVYNDAQDMFFPESAIRRRAHDEERRLLRLELSN
jgi:hypothetical protein